jgi:hypothetical protein
LATTPEAISAANYKPEISHLEYDTDLYKKQLAFIETHDPKNKMGDEYYTDTPSVK